MNKIQVASYAKKLGICSKYAECTTLAEPLSPDSFLYNFYDLTDAKLWRYRGRTHTSIDNIDDFRSIRTMIKNSCSAVNIIVLPGNLNYYYNYGSSMQKYYDHCELKNMISDLKQILLVLVPIPFPEIYYENTITIVNGYKTSASFCFEDGTEKPITVSDGSLKNTTYKVKNRLFLTTLNIFETSQIFEAFLNLFLPQKNDEAYPEWLDKVDILDDQEQRDKINQSRLVIDDEQAKIELAEERLAANLKYKSVLSTNGEALVKIVFEILQELLDCDLSQFRDEYQEDFEIQKSDVTFIGEIKGVTSNVRSEHISQLEVHCQKYQDRLQEEGKEENVKGLLIINHQRNYALQERQEVHRNQIALAERYKSLIIETRELLNLFVAKRMGNIGASQICCMFKEMTGIFCMEIASKGMKI